MKKKIFVIFALLTVALLCFTACNNTGVADYQKLNDLLKVNYTKVTLLVSTKTATAELEGNFVLTFDGDDVNVQYKFDRLNTFDVDDNGNIADADGEFIIHEEGEAVVRDGEIVDGDMSVELPIDELTVSGFSFKQAFFAKATFKNAKFEADVVNPQGFTGSNTLVCSDMHVVVFQNLNAGTLSNIELTYTANGADVTINYFFTK